MMSDGEAQSEPSNTETGQANGNLIPYSAIRDPQSGCGCCTGVEKLTPMITANRPGLPALAYRVGIHETFLETMKARLTGFSLEIQRDLLGPDGKPLFDRIYPLLGLTTRDSGDFAIGLLDAWSTVGDVLTFYQERIANEGYLRTALERRSILELARLIGYAPRPGVAASVFLALTLDKGHKVNLKPGEIKAQSVPGPGELAQTFENAEDLDARAVWNILGPRLSRPQTKTSIKKRDGAGNFWLYLKGISTNLNLGDPLLIDFGSGTPESAELFRVVAVKPDAAADRTLVAMQEWLPKPVAGRSTAEEISAETKAKLRVVIAKHLGPEAAKFAVPKEGDAYKNVDSYLESLKWHLADDVPFPTMISYLRDVTLVKLAEELAKFEGESEGTTGPWIEGLITELKDVARTAANLRAEALAREFTLPSESGTGFAPQSDPFKEVVGGLIKPPSVPPPNALQLGRSLDAAFQSKADAGLQVLGAVREGLRESLPIAVANTKVSPDVRIKVYALRTKASVFGYNAQKRTRIISTSTVGGTEIQVIGEWPIVELVSDVPTSHEEKSGDIIYLDGGNDKILPGTWTIIDAIAVDKETERVKPAVPRLLITRIKNVQPNTSRGEYGMVGPTTRIELERKWITIDFDHEVSNPQPLRDIEFQIIRRTKIFAQSEELPLAEAPIDDPICGSNSATEPNAFIELDGLYSDLDAGRWLIVSGQRTDIKAADPDTGQAASVPGLKFSELVMLAEVVHRVSESDAVQVGYYGYGPGQLPGEKTHTFIRLARRLEFCYRRDQVTIYGNVVKATHGETRNEVLGGGDASKTLQSFTLKQSPLTFVAAPNPRGVDSTLHVRVNSVEWHETGTLAELGPANRNFITRTDDDDKVTVVFGNGERGARLPTGAENVTAVYRNGIGKPGNVKADQISLLATQVLGVKGVINPLRASGGANRENRDQARKNAPLAVLALDRLISTQDYADFARTFAGIGKASAVRLSDGRRQVVFVTIAGADDIPIDKTSDLYRNLVKALHRFGDPFQPVQVELRELLLLIISANVRLLPDYLWESVVTKIRARLLDAFSFERSELAQDVVLSEVISVIQAVEGVAYVGVDTLGAVPEKTRENRERRLLTPDEIVSLVQRQVAESKLRGPRQRIVVHEAGFETNPISPAQLAFLTPDVPAALILNEIK